MFRPSKLDIQFLVPRPHPPTAGRVPCAHAQLNYVAVAFGRIYRPWLRETTPRIIAGN